MQIPTLFFLLQATLFGISNAATYSNVTTKTPTKAVFAHYMVGTLSEEHAKNDIDDALAMGLDAFALNVGDPTSNYTNTTLEILFKCAAKTSFKLFISIDLAGAGNVCKGVTDYKSLLQKYITHPSYFQGPNDAPFISTFSDGGLQNVNWTSFLNSVANKTYFVPDFDGTQGYYQAALGWWDYWGDVVDGVFSWESNWMQTLGTGVGAASEGDVSLDEIVINGFDSNGTAAHNKSYMIGLSAMQYKDAYNGNYYRNGGLNFPIRMKNILSMDPAPDFAEIITWNDGPESHYIGTLWPEANDDQQAALYCGPSWEHTGWQQIFTSFVTAFKAKLPATKMAPPDEKLAVGAMWYKTILQSSYCNNITYNDEPWTLVNNDTCPTTVAPEDYYYPKPTNFKNGTDAHNWAVVLSESANSSTYHLRTSSDGVIIGNATLVSGLNYGTFHGIRTGKQKMDVLDSLGNVVMSSEEGPRGVSYRCRDGIYNMNYEVVGLKSKV